VTLPRFIRSIFPAARHPLTLPALLPLVFFLTLFAAAVIVCEARPIVHFTRKPAFFLMLATPWIWWMHHAGAAGLSGWRAQAALFSRLLLAGVFAAVLAEPRAVRKSDALSIVYALDVSDSIGQAISDKSLAWVRKTAAQKPEKDEAGLVVFGRDAAVELPPRATLPLEAINSVVAKDATNLAKALRMAAAVLPEGNSGRIVLISDGNQSEGEFLPALDEMKSRGIAVDVLGIDFDFQKEVWLERLDLPRTIRRGETYDAVVLLSALTAGKGTLRLTENGKTVIEKEVEYAAGKNRFSLPLPRRGPGFYEYLAAIQVPKGEDSWAENNQAMADLYLKGEGRILVLTDAHGDAREWEPLVAALKQGERIVQVRMAYEFPRDAMALLPYDLIIVPNAPADAFDAPQLQAMHDAVFNFGIGLLMLGSEHTFGPGGYHRTVIEDALPVEMDVSQKKVLPSGALLVVLDSSGSMSAEVAGRTKISLADRGALLALRTLGPQDYFGVVAVDTQPHVVLPLAQHGSATEDITKKILSVTAGGGGIYIYTSLAHASLALREVNANIKHVILFSDAADAEQQTADAEQQTADAEANDAKGTTALALARAMSDAKITVSVVALGTERDKDTAFLRDLAEEGRGRFYLTDDATTLPQIFTKEAITLKRSMLQNRTFAAQPVFPSPVIKGIEALPPLHGYVLTTPKARASIILQAPPTAEEAANGDAPDPVLAIWRYGLGTSAAWTSDLAPNWARDWVGWEKYRAFVKQLATEVSRVEQHSDLTMTAFASGSQGIVSVEDFAKDESFLEMKARVSGPRGETVQVPLKQIAPRRYHGEFPLWGTGRYQVTAIGMGMSGGAMNAKRNEQASGGFAVPYSPEYLRFKSNPIALKQIAERTGGRMLSPTDLDIFHPPRSARESSRPIFDWFLIALACLIPIDVGLRRVQLDWQVIKGWFGFGRKAGSTETMGALLQRKMEAQAAITPAERANPVILKSASTTAPPPATPVSKPQPKPDEPASTDEPQSTTERLLARKRKRQDGGK
jgi:uncharacterized membrane protein